MRLNQVQGGTVSVDDSVFDKPYTNDFVFLGYYWSGKHHAVVKKINLITLYYTDPHGQHQPIHFRVYDKADHKTKNDYFLEMFAEVLSGGLEPAFVMGDRWSSCVKNLKTIKNHPLVFLFALETNRIKSFQVRGKIAVKNPTFVAICGYAKLQHLRAIAFIKSCHQLQCNLFNEMISSFINSFVKGMEHMNPQLLSIVNA